MFQIQIPVSETSFLINYGNGLYVASFFYAKFLPFLSISASDSFSLLNVMYIFILFYQNQTTFPIKTGLRELKLRCGQVFVAEGSKLNFDTSDQH
jgi:hypothetical protein